MKTLAERLQDIFDDPRPIHEIMRADERAAGRLVIVPGDREWLPASDWHPTVVVSLDGKEVRLVAILSQAPGTGTFRRLIDGISAAGLRPVIVEPTHEMRKTVKRWGWRVSFVGAGFEQQELWRPVTKSSEAA